MQMMKSKFHSHFLKQPNMHEPRELMVNVFLALVFQPIGINISDPLRL